MSEPKPWPPERRTLIWTPEDRYRSNNGKGPLMARILSEEPKYLEMEAWNESAQNPRRLNFKLSAKFLASENCRWKKVGNEHR